MSTEDAREMDPAEISGFLAQNGTGVLSLAAENIPYSIPVSYGYDFEEETFYFRLGFLEGSEKRRFVDASEQGRLVVYDRTDDGWKSVVALGELERIDDDELTVDVAKNLRETELPLVGLWEEPMDDIEFQIYRFEVERLTGRKEASETSP